MSDCVTPRQMLCQPCFKFAGDQRAPQSPPDLGFAIHYTGHLHYDLSLRAVYSAADVFMLASRQDNLINTSVETLACGTPVVAFDTYGSQGIAEHKNGLSCECV